MIADAPDPADVLEIVDPEIDVPALMARIRTNLAQRGEAAGPEPQDEERARRFEALLVLQERIAHFGDVATLKSGFKGRIELIFKRILRKLIKRHLIQQQEVNQALVGLLSGLMTQIEDLEAQQSDLKARLASVSKAPGEPI